MNIAMVFDGLGFGGVERVGVNYAKILISLGHKVTVINLQPRQTAMEGSFPSECEIIHTPMPMAVLPDFFLPIVRKWWWGKYAYSATYLIAKVLLLVFRCLHVKRRSFDVAIAFSGHIRDLTYVSYRFVKADKTLGWVHGCISNFLLMSYSFKNLYLKIRNLCVLSEQNQVQALHFCDFPKDALNISLLHNPIDQLPLIADMQLVESLKREYGEFLLVVGRFDIDKDQATIIRAMKVLADYYGLSPFVLFVGDGPTRMDCERLASDLGIADRMVFLGLRDDVDDFYSAAHLFVHSSPGEGLPTVLLEAMRCELPIVATNSLPGVAEILGDSENGLVCEVGDPDEMAEGIALMLSDKELRDSYAQRGKMKLNDFSPERIGRKLQMVLDGLV